MRIDGGGIYSRINVGPLSGLVHEDVILRDAATAKARE
jgi:hypothetical protein